MVDQPKRRGGRFFGRRVNCEQVPLLPAQAVGRVLDDPRRISYLFVWSGKRDGQPKEAVRVARYGDPGAPISDSQETFCVRRETRPETLACDWVAVKRTDGTCDNLCAVLRPLPRNGGKVRLLICPYCQIPRRALYGWQVDHWGPYTNSARVCPWRCRACASLRYASEGGALVLRSRWSFFRMIEQRYGGCRSPRPEPWYPYVFTSINDPRLDEILRQNRS
jgi:hypothetical protein